MRLRTAVLAAFLALASACAPQAERIASASAAREKPVWAFQASDIPVDPAYRFGLLPNGMRYVIRHNATPRGTAIVRMEVQAGSLDEADSERGFAHFVEHMAFNGSTHVPEGEMVRLLERNGLAFGADTNASTSFDRTTYKLDLPKNDPQLLDTALMLMRETATELTFAPEAVSRERGVVLAEMRDRDTYQMRNAQADANFMNPKALYTERFPIGTLETLNAATAQSLKAFWQREYVPAHTTVIVIGDFDPALVEAQIVGKFSSWQPEQAEPQPSGGPVIADDGGRTDIYIDPAQSNRITAQRNGPWLDGPDTVAQRQENLLRQIGYGIVNRRLERLSNQAEPPFRAAGYGTGDIFEAGRSTRLIVDLIDKHWQRGLDAAVREYRRALKYGFDKSEVAEQLATIRRSVENAAASADTRNNYTLEAAIYELLRDDVVPSTPQTVLERFDAFAPTITPKAVLKAMKREALPLDDPLLRFRGRDPIEGGTAALRTEWNEAVREPVKREKSAAATEFGYTTFGTPGTVVADSTEPELGIRELRFANGVRLNLKHTANEKDSVVLVVSVDGGDRLNTIDNPHATVMTRDLREGGLGKHSDDDLTSILAGKTVRYEASSDADAFSWTARTTPADLDLQLRIVAAYVTDPGFRSEGELKFRHYINNYFAQRFATPGSTIGATLGAILSDDDPRFSLDTVKAYRELTFAKFKADIADRLAHGAIEIGIVGDFDEQAAIDAVARTFGALPQREPDFHDFSDQPARPFTADRTRHVVRHTGPADQALIQMVWPTRDDSDPQETMALELLERVVRIELTETLREKLGKAYSPSASSSLSRYWRGYGTFAISASVDVHEVPATEAAIAETLAALRDAPIDPDIIQRARQPMIEAHDNALKSNGGWLSLVDRAQTQPDQIDRYQTTVERLNAVNPERLQDLAQRYLVPDKDVEVLVLPEGVDVPAQP